MLLRTRLGLLPLRSISVYSCQICFHAPIMATEAAKLPKTGAVQDSWRQPTRAPGREDPTIKVYNSLTRTKVGFGRLRDGL